jgi:hypothetical protein
LENDKVNVTNGSAVVLSRTDKVVVERGVKVLGYMPKSVEHRKEVRVLGGISYADPRIPKMASDLKLTIFYAD